MIFVSLLFDSPIRRLVVGIDGSTCLTKTEVLLTRCDFFFLNFKDRRAICIYPMVELAVLAATGTEVLAAKPSPFIGRAVGCQGDSFSALSLTSEWVETLSEAPAV